jgi:catechol 2,3-dioxygenase-like lactoylglutathione lyase family enzyme
VERLTPPARLHHLALRVADVARSAAFYTDLLGLREVRRFEDSHGLRSVWLRAGDVVVMLEKSLRGAGAEAGSGHLLALAVDDLARWEVLLGAAGVAVDDRTSYTLYVRDPDGHRVGLTVFEE